MITSVQCSHCGAPFRAADARFCSICGNERPEPAQLPAPLAPDAPERFVAAERHTSVPELLGHSPSTAGHMTSGWCSIVFLILFCAGAASLWAVSFAMGWTDDAELGWLFSLVPIVLGSVGLAFLIFSVVGVVRFRSAELVRSIALVVDKRTRVGGGEVPNTTCLASLETKDRKRREYQVSCRLAQELTVGDLGMAYTKGDVLLDFKRIEP